MACITVSINQFPELSNQRGQQAFFDEELCNDGYKVEQSKIVKGNYYALVKDTKVADDRKFIMVAFFDCHGDDFIYKILSEGNGPIAYDCPARMIQRADEPMNDTANQWRQKCAGKRSQQQLLEMARKTNQTILVHWDDGDYECHYFPSMQAWLHEANDGYYDRFKIKDILEAGFDVIA